jgi:hypothetical protein
MLPLVIFLFFLSGNAQAKEPPRYVTVSFTELINAPEAFNEKAVAVSGFLKIQYAPHELTALFLYSTEDAAGLRDAAILIHADSKILANRDKLNGRYVKLIGKFKITPTATGSEIVSISDVKSCVPIPSRATDPMTSPGL